MPRRSASSQNTRSVAAPLGKGPLLRSIRRRAGGDDGRFPFSVPAVRSLESLDLPGPVTFFVGENGSGKSTLLEAIAVAAGFNPEGGSKNFRFATRSSESPLHRYLRLVKSPRRRREFSVK